MVSGLGCRVRGLGFRLQDFGFRVSGSGVSGLGFRVSGFGLGVSGLGFRAWVHPAGCGAHQGQEKSRLVNPNVRVSKPLAL